jgi:hypothetical protein
MAAFFFLNPFVFTSAYTVWAAARSEYPPEKNFKVLFDSAIDKDTRPQIRISYGQGSRSGRS